jgi:hypothetical protein
MATQLGKNGLPIEPNGETLEWVRGVGETRSFERTGKNTDIKDEYEALKSDLDVNQLTYNNREGRCTLVARFVRNDVDGGSGDRVTLIEELLGIDIVRNIYAAPLFAALDDDELAAVLLAVENRQQDADIEDFAGWNDTQKELRWQMLHGQESYFETAFVLRVRKQGARTSALQGVFTGINTVRPLPTLSAGMTALTGTLPAGEWLYKPPQITYVQRGIWNVDSEWHWAVKWSVVYGGTMKGFL